MQHDDLLDGEKNAFCMKFKEQFTLSCSCIFYKNDKKKKAINFNSTFFEVKSMYSEMYVS